MAIAAALAASLGAACDDAASTGGAGGATASSSSTGLDAGCANDPFACPAGKTCGFVDVQGATLECLPSGVSMVGEACKNIVGAPECGDGLICLQLQGETGGTCAPFCDAAHPCAEGDCSNIHTAAGNVFHACLTMTMTTSSSSGSTTSSTSSSSSTGSSSSSGAGSSSSTGP